MSDLLVNQLLAQAREIAEEGHAGWGNTMTSAAERILDLKESSDAWRLDFVKAQNRIAELEAEIEAKCQWNQKYDAFVAEQAEKIATLQAENEAMKEKTVWTDPANVVALMERIAALEKVAEAALPLCKAIGDTQEYSSLWWILDEALREAGYLKEEG